MEKTKAAIIAAIQAEVYAQSSRGGLVIVDEVCNDSFGTSSALIIEAPPQVPSIPLSGKEARRKRRKEERNHKK